MIDLLQSVGSGVLVGLVYALLGLCIVIIFKASEAFNFAIGEFLIIGSFLFYTLFFNETIPWYKALQIGILIFLFFYISYVMCILVFRDFSPPEDGSMHPDPPHEFGEVG